MWESRESLCTDEAEMYSVSFTIFYGGFGVAGFGFGIIDLRGHVDCRVRPRFYRKGRRVRRASAERTSYNCEVDGRLWYFT